MMRRGFDWIAPHYDMLARLVFGRSIRRCQLEFLDKIPRGASVLILGGGTGWILKDLAGKNPTCKVWYVEASGKMIERAEKLVKDLASFEVNFIQGSERDLKQIVHPHFNAVIANFYFDLFGNVALQEVLTQIRRKVHSGSLLLVAEFVERSWWHRIFLFVMYRFFRWTCTIEASRLPEWEDQVRRNGFTERENETFFKGFIKSSVFEFQGSGSRG